MKRAIIVRSSRLKLLKEMQLSHTISTGHVQLDCRCLDDQQAHADIVRVKAVTSIYTSRLYDTYEKSTRGLWKGADYNNYE